MADGIVPDRFTFSALIEACSKGGEVTLASPNKHSNVGNQINLSKATRTKVKFVS